MTVGTVYNAIGGIAPFSLAESWDNSGLLVGSKDTPVRGILVALDATSDVIEEAKQAGANLIVTHHPVIFSPLKSIGGDSVVYSLIQNGMSVISAHTNLDIVSGGVGDCLARRLGLTDIRPLDAVSSVPYYKVGVTIPLENKEAVYSAMAKAGAGTLGNYTCCGFFTEGEGRFLPMEGANPAVGMVGAAESVAETRLEMIAPPECLDTVIAAMKAAHPYEEAAYDIYENHAVTRTEALGRVGRLPNPMPPREFAAYVKEKLGARGVRYTEGKTDVETVALCGGSGADYLYRLPSLGAQALVTADVKYHHLLDAGHMGVTLADAGHFDTEAVVLESLAAQLQERLPDAKVILSVQSAPAYFV